MKSFLNRATNCIPCLPKKNQGSERSSLVEASADTFEIYAPNVQPHLPRRSRHSSGLHHSTGQNASASYTQKLVLEGVQHLSDDPAVLYMAEFRKLPDAATRNAQITEAVRAIGFERPSDDEYIYRGNDPATALDKLADVRPLILDCGTALHLATFIAIKHAIGPSQFNAYISEMHDGVLSIDKQQAPAVPTDHTAFYSARHEQQENVLPSNLQHGDRLWVQGPAHGYAFHPASEVNGFNVQVDTSNPNKTMLAGFVSNSDGGHGKWSYEGLKQFLLDAYNKPLTLRDVAILRSKAGQLNAAHYSSWTPTDALQ